MAIKRKAILKGRGFKPRFSVSSHPLAVLARPNQGGFTLGIEAVNHAIGSIGALVSKQRIRHQAGLLCGRLLLASQADPQVRRNPNGLRSHIHAIARILVLNPPLWRPITSSDGGVNSRPIPCRHPGQFVLKHTLPHPTL